MVCLIVLAGCKERPKTKELLSGSYSFDFSYKASETVFSGNLFKNSVGGYEITMNSPESVRLVSFLYLSGNMTVIYEGLDRYEIGLPPERSVVGILCLSLEKAEKSSSLSGEDYKITMKNLSPIKLEAGGVSVKIENFAKK